jgi:hypothetical protein
MGGKFSLLYVKFATNRIELPVKTERAEMFHHGTHEPKKILIKNFFLPA